MKNGVWRRKQNNFGETKEQKDNVVVESATILLCFIKVLDLSLGQQIVYSERVLRGFPQLIPTHARVVL
jgi:hypothetical protein